MLSSGVAAEVELSPWASGCSRRSCFSPPGPRELGVASLPPSSQPASRTQSNLKAAQETEKAARCSSSCFVPEHSAGSGRDAGSQGALAAFLWRPAPAACRWVWGSGAWSPLRGWMGAGVSSHAGRSQACCEGRLAAQAAVLGATPPQPSPGAPSDGAPDTRHTSMVAFWARQRLCFF